MTVPTMLNAIQTGVECGDIPLQASSNRSVPRVSVLSREVGGRASFSCHTGFGLRGPSETTCLSTGEWAQPFPSCMGTSIPSYGENHLLIHFSI